MASVPSVSNRQNSSGEETPPGNRQLMPMMAIGSSGRAGTGVSSAARGVVPSSSASRNSARATGVG